VSVLWSPLSSLFSLVRWEVKTTFGIFYTGIHWSVLSCRFNLVVAFIFLFLSEVRSKDDCRYLPYSLKHAHSHMPRQLVVIFIFLFLSEVRSENYFLSIDVFFMCECSSGISILVTGYGTLCFGTGYGVCLHWSLSVPFSIGISPNPQAISKWDFGYILQVTHHLFVTKFLFYIFLSYNLPTGSLSSVLKIYFFAKILYKIIFCKNYSSPLNTSMRKGKEPDPNP
jgi:hypothetical protein